jgi:hypothetical protein
MSADDSFGNYLDSEIVGISEDLDAEDLVQSGRFIVEPPLDRIARTLVASRRLKPDIPRQSRF